ncbi:hypothetical protein ACWOC1_13635 [Enterococcus quebecensis]|uniref:ABC transporter substrate-binding protein n=1 Tax=Enterococcus quebecensis TaxID=903983 RepID=A0A1E5GRY3_9ENTE|nr:hypothetical protein [Enterococcus quebecensis]OEG15325.1 hypothetical protein BCR23_10855 [Enterococcus quebecensis]OJG72288.1 hypothetical protein RV12_GL000994 [Enterococcus quebecensis]
MKKRTIGIFALSAVLMTVTLTACGAKEKDAGDKGQLSGKKFDKKESDVVSERNEVIDGQEMTVKTFSDGTEMTLPKGINLDDSEIQALE